MPPRCRPAVLPDHRHLPESVIEILLGQRPQRRTYVVPGSNARTLPYPATSQRETKIPLVILIAFQRDIEHADTVECLPPPAPEINGINIPFISRIVRS